MKFALFLMGDRRPERVDVSLGLFDGRLYTHTILSPRVNRWLEMDIPAGSFRLDGMGLGAGEHVQVIAVKAYYPLVSHLMSYTILLDDFSLNGARKRLFIAREPESSRFDKFGVSILHRHFFFGDAIGISVSPEGGRKLTKVECTVLNPTGGAMARGTALYDDGTHGDAKPGDGIWTNKKIYTISRSDPRGQWILKVVGKSGAEVTASCEFRFLMPGRRLTPEDHPRLFFTRDELKERLASGESPAAKKILENAVSNFDESYYDIDIDAIEEGRNIPTESLTGGPYSRTGKSYSRWRGPMSRLGSIIRRGAWRYAFTGDERAGMVAKKALLKLCSFEVWNHPWMEAHGRHIYFPVGYTTKEAAVGYDLLYPLLSGEERRIVREAVMEKAIKHFHRDMVEMNRMPSNLSNHIAVIVSGLGLAAVTMYGDDPGNPFMEPYLSGILTKMKTFMDRTYMPEGSYGEPYTYQAMASRDLTETLCALERNFGIDYTTTTNLKDAYIYPLYVTHSSGRYQDFGDVSHWYGMTQTHMQWLTYRMRNPWTYAYLKPYYESGKGGFLGYLWYVDGITPRYRGELPTSKLFAHKGNMVMRSDWKDEGTIMIFKCGPNSNHYHLDQGTFVIMTNGTELLSDAGHSSGYYSNLYYPCYYTQAMGHNVMLVDMNPESQGIADYENGIAALRDYPRIVHHFAGDTADEVEGDLTCVYKGVLSSYRRSLLFLKPDLIFLLDRVESHEGHEYDWVFHAEHTNDKSSISYEDGTVTITRPKAALTMEILAPEIASSTIRDSDRDESFIVLSSGDGLTETAFLAVLMPGAAGKDDGPDAKRGFELVRSGGWLGARSESGEGLDLAMFRLSGNEAKDAVVDGIETDADRFAVTMDGEGKTRRLFFLAGTRFSRRGTAPYIFTSDRRVSAAISYGAEGARLEVDAPGAAEVTITAFRKPETVSSGGRAFKGWKYDGRTGTVTLRLPKGHTRLLMR